MKSTTYWSSISPILWTIVWLIIGIVCYVTVKPAVADPQQFIATLLLFIWIPIIVCLLVVMLGIRYELNSQELRIKIGPITERVIPLEEIWTLSRSYDAIASPANGLKRMKITYAQGEVFISPADEQKFLKHVCSINPKIQLIRL